MSHRDKLLEGAVDCLRDKGYARTTARDLVAASGTNLASIGYHFGSKEALLNEAIAEGFRAWTAEVETATFGSQGAGSLSGCGTGWKVELVELASKSSPTKSKPPATRQPGPTLPHSPNSGSL